MNNITQQTHTQTHTGKHTKHHKRTITMIMLAQLINSRILIYTFWVYGASIIILYNVYTNGSKAPRDDRKSINSRVGEQD